MIEAVHGSPQPDRSNGAGGKQQPGVQPASPGKPGRSEA
jgi:hypothetical protein